MKMSCGIFKNVRVSSRGGQSRPRLSGEVPPPGDQLVFSVVGMTDGDCARTTADEGRAFC